MIATKNWVRFIKFKIIKQVKIGLVSIFQLATAEATTVEAPSTKEFPGGGRSLILLLAYLPVLRTSLSSDACKFHLFDSDMIVVLAAGCMFQQHVRMFVRTIF